MSFKNPPREMEVAPHSLIIKMGGNTNDLPEKEELDYLPSLFGAKTAES
jgi:hypothetical protein